jgi:SAM-dependent methyltransferase
MIPHKVCGLIIDRFYGIETEGWRTLTTHDQSRSRYGDGHMYQTCPYSILWSSLRRLPPGLDGTFYDLGCGKGRAVAVFAKSNRFESCAGIELVPSLAEQARKNLQLLRAKTPTTIVTADVTAVDFSDGVVFFLHNPFGSETLTTVLRNIEKTRKRKPAYFIVYGLFESHIYDSCPWLERYWTTPRWGIWRGVV